MSAADFHTLAGASRAIANKSLSPIDLTDHYLERIEAANGTLDAFILITADLAREQARVADMEIRAGRSRGALHGLPIGYKDIFDTAGIRTTGHSRVMLDRVPDADAVSVAKMAAAGMVCLGKLATHEFAFGGPSFDLAWPPAKNPWSLTNFTGGSSSGSGAAVTGGLAPAAFGSDTGGSIRLPAAYCGLVGIKPTYGRVSRRGVLPLAYSLDHAGPMAWTAEDCAMMMEAMAGFDAGDPGSVDVPVPAYSKMLDIDMTGVRIGVVRHFWEQANAVPEVVDAMSAALKVYEKLGAKLVELTLPSLTDFHSAGFVLLHAEALAVHEKNFKATPEKFGEILRKRLYVASTLSATDYVQAMRRRRELCDAYALATKDVDVVFTATTAGPAPRFDEFNWLDIFGKPNLTMPFNVTGSPTVATRAGFSSTGLPLSFQLAGKPFDEATVLAVAHAYEQATDWKDRRPKL